MAPVRSQALQRQGNGETETSLTKSSTFTERDGACRVSLPPVCSPFRRLLLRRRRCGWRSTRTGCACSTLAWWVVRPAEAPGNYVTLLHMVSLLPRTRCSRIPTSVWSPLAVAVTTSWWSPASRESLVLGGGAWRSWCLRWRNQRWVNLTHLQNSEQHFNNAQTG